MCTEQHYQLCSSQREMDHVYLITLLNWWSPCLLRLPSLPSEVAEEGVPAMRGSGLQQHCPVWGQWRTLVLLGQSQVFTLGCAGRELELCCTLCGPGSYRTLESPHLPPLHPDGTENGFNTRWCFLAGLRSELVPPFCIIVWYRLVTYTKGHRKNQALDEKINIWDIKKIQLSGHNRTFLSQNGLSLKWVL